MRKRGRREGRAGESATNRERTRALTREREDARGREKMQKGERTGWKVRERERTRDRETNLYECVMSQI